MSTPVTDRPRWSRPVPASAGRWWPWVYAAALTWWAASWNLRNSVLMSWSPVEPVWIGSGLLVLCVVHRLGRPVVLPPGVVVPLALLVVAFVPGALLSDTDGYGPTKVAALAVTLLPVLLAAVLLLDHERMRANWVWSQVAVGLAVALAAVMTADAADLVLVGGRLTLPTVDTISTGRLVGAAVVPLLVLGLASSRLRWVAWPVAVAAGAVLVQVGSRGPLLAAVVSLVVVICAAKCFAGRRGWPLAMVALASVAAYVFALRGGGAGGRRIVDSVQGGLGDETRADLVGEALGLGMSRLLGVGWGDFARHSETGRAIANEDGAAYAHNVFAETFAEGGVLALLGVAMLAVLALVRLRRASLTPAGAAALGLAVYWLLNAQVSSDVVGNRFLWIALVAGLVASVSHPPTQPSGDARSASPAAADA